MGKKAIIVAVCACAFAALAVMAGCSCSGGPLGGKAVNGVWHFESMEAAPATLEGLNDQEKADKEAEAQMLAVFMSDASVEFGDNGAFTFTFLGDKYTGKWESGEGGAVVTMEGDDYSSAAGTYVVKDGKLVFTAKEGSGRLEGFVVTYAEGPVETAQVVTSEQSGASSAPVEQPKDESASASSAASEQGSAPAEPAGSSQAAESAGSASASAASAGSSAASDKLDASDRPADEGGEDGGKAE